MISSDYGKIDLAKSNAMISKSGVVFNATYMTIVRASKNTITVKYSKGNIFDKGDVILIYIAKKPQGMEEVLVPGSVSFIIKDMISPISTLDITYKVKYIQGNYELIKGGVTGVRIGHKPYKIRNWVKRFIIAVTFFKLRISFFNWLECEIINYPEDDDLNWWMILLRFMILPFNTIWEYRQEKKLEVKKEIGSSE